MSATLKVLKQNGCSFGIKSGGHGLQPGATNIDNGVTIDLRRLNRLELSADKKTVKVEPAMVWKHVYEMLEPEGLYVLGGRVANVGVGGFLLGGKSSAS